MNLDKLPTDLQQVVDHHTHLCAGVLIGYKAAKYAIDLIGKSERMLVVASTEGCGNDAMKVMLNCSRENGSLVCQPGKGQFWSIYNYEEEDGITLSLNPAILQGLAKEKEKGLDALLNMRPDLLFNVLPFEPTQTL